MDSEKTHLDEATGEYVSKRLASATLIPSELKRRQKLREKAAKKVRVSQS